MTMTLRVIVSLYKYVHTVHVTSTSPILSAFRRCLGLIQDGAPEISFIIDYFGYSVAIVLVVCHSI